MKFARFATRALSGLALLAALPFTQAEPLKIGYSDWPGWIAWEIGIKKGWFEDAGVEVDFQWMDYVASMDAYVAGQLDAVCMTNGDALAIGGTGKPSVGILINDYSNGNDMLVAAPGISSVSDLKGKKIGVEEGFVAHLLALKALESAGLGADDVEWVNVPTNETPQVLATGAVDAIAAWQPNSGQALKTVSGSTPVFTSADAPGIIYDLLYVSSESLEARRDDWQKVTKVWYQIVEYINNEDNIDEALEILSARVALSPQEYEPFFQGTKILSLRLAKKIWEDSDSLKSVYGSSRIVNEFNVDQGVYDTALNIESYLDPSFTEALK